MSVPVRTLSASLEFGTPGPLFALPVTGSGILASYPYDVMSDGQRFLAPAPAGDAESPPMTVMINWQAGFPAANQ